MTMPRASASLRVPVCLRYCSKSVPGQNSRTVAKESLLMTKLSS